MERLLRYKKLVPIFLIFTVAWGFSFYISTRLLMRETQEIVVPKVIGFPLAEAQMILKQHKLEFRVDSYEESPEVPQNTVISQSVEAGTIVKENRTILLGVSKEKEKLEIPNLVAKDLVEARKIIEKQNLKLSSIVYGCSQRISRGKVASQTPLHEELAQTSDIALLVSSGPCQSQFVIGNLVDRKVDETLKKEFSDRDIDLKLISQSTRESLKKARVVSQDPSPGSVVKSGDNVVLNME